MRKTHCPFPCSKLMKQSFGWMREGIDEQEFFGRWRALLQKQKQYQKKHRSKPSSKESHRNSMREWRAAHPELSRLMLKRSYHRHIEKRREGAKEARRKLKLNPEKLAAHRMKVQERKRNRYWSDLGYRLRRRISGRVRRAIAVQHRGGRGIELLGCSVSELKQYIETLWSPGMSWVNYGREGWHIDHIIPCASFDLTDTEQQKACFHYSNLQPLWWRDNLSKGARR